MERYKNPHSRTKGGDRPAITGAYFVDHDNGWIFTSWLENLSTHDAGKTWSRFASKVIGPNKDSEYLEPSNVVFANKLEGLLIAGPAGKGSVFKTKDGGKTWTQISANDRFYDLSLRRCKKFCVNGHQATNRIRLGEGER